MFKLTNRKRISTGDLDKESIDWLIQRRKEGATWEQIEFEAGVHRSTLIKLVKKLGIESQAQLGQIAPSAGSQRPATQTWDRPCLRCGAKRKRPRGLFLCDPCRRQDLGSGEGKLWLP